MEEVALRVSSMLPHEASRRLQANGVTHLSVVAPPTVCANAGVAPGGVTLGLHQINMRNY